MYWEYVPARCTYSVYGIVLVVLTAATVLCRTYPKPRLLIFPVSCRENHIILYNDWSSLINYGIPEITTLSWLRIPILLVKVWEIKHTNGDR